MRRFLFSIDDIAEEVVEFDDNVTEREVDREFNQWVLDTLCPSLSCGEIEEEYDG